MEVIQPQYSCLLDSGYDWEGKLFGASYNKEEQETELKQ